jgi:hypothetical protein
MRRKAGDGHVYVVRPAVPKQRRAWWRPVLLAAALAFVAGISATILMPVIILPLVVGRGAVPVAAEAVIVMVATSR